MFITKYTDGTYSSFLVKSKNGLLSTPGLYEKFCKDINIEAPFTEAGVADMNRRFRKMMTSIAYSISKDEYNFSK